MAGLLLLYLQIAIDCLITAGSGQQGQKYQ